MSNNITIGKLKNAQRRALNIFDKWNNVTGYFQKDSGYYYEIQSVIEDAVHCGTQAACNVAEPLSSER